MRRAALLLVVFASTSAYARPHHAKKHLAKGIKHREVAATLPTVGQSIGAPWAGRLHDPARLPDGDGYVIRRPWRAFGTSKAVELVERVVTEWREQFPESHVLAIGDLSAEHGGAITEHHSHQSGRDADIGLIYNEKPRGYPESFIDATEDNLDCEATFALVEAFAETAKEDGGAQMMFLDFKVQGMLYRWAKEHDVDEDKLDRLFQFPHGRGSMAGMVHHEPNHANHLHVRFRCPRGDVSCQ
jgi:murein endopeptidase